MSVQCPKCDFINPSESEFCNKCGTQIQPLDDIRVDHTKTTEMPKEEIVRGTLFADRYEIIEALGKGGMGSVYRVEDKKTNEELALKLIKPEISADKATIDRFSNELSLAHKISHRNVCRMYHLGEEKGTHYITMEYVPGEDLKSFIRRSERLAIHKAISITKQVCEGLAEAHRLGVVHRDLKPSNIMIDKDGNAHIMDFGIARSLTELGQQREKAIVGTLQYMSPEQLGGKELDQRTDIYSLGVVLYEMLTGYRPYEKEIPEDPSKINQQIPQELSGLIFKCLEKKKEDRYKSASEIRAELVKIETTIPSTTKEATAKKPFTAKEVTVHFSMRSLWKPALLVVGLGLVFAIILWLRPSNTLMLSSGDKPSIAVVYFENNTGDTGLDHYRKAICDLLITDLAQSKYLRVLSGSRLYHILKDFNLHEVRSYSSEDLKHIAESGGVEHIILGNYNRAGDMFRINVSLQEAVSGELVATDRVEGTGENSIFFMVDDLTQKIKNHLQLSTAEITGDIDKRIGQITSHSPEAVRHFMEGQRLYDDGRLEESVKAFEKAIAIDPDFAMAYKQIAISYDYLMNSDKCREHMQKAVSLIDRVSERERYLILGLNAYIETGSLFESIGYYKDLLTIYPDDLQGRIYLGAIYRNLEEWDLSHEEWKRTVQIDPEYELGYTNMAYGMIAKGLYDKALDLLQANLSRFSDKPHFHWFMARIHLAQGRFRESLQEMNEASALDPEDWQYYIYEGNNFYLQGELPKAEESYRLLLDNKSPQSQVTGFHWLAHLYFLQGQYDRALQEIDSGLQVARDSRNYEFEIKFLLLSFRLFQRLKKFEAALDASNQARQIAIDNKFIDDEMLTLHSRGQVLLELGRLDQAEETADELKQYIEQKGCENYLRRYYHLMGIISEAQDQVKQSIDYLERAYSLLPEQMSASDRHAFYLEALAHISEKSGLLGKAQDYYEQIISLTVGRLIWGDIYAFSLYRLGKLYEQQGDTVKAIEQYEKVLDLWKDADPGIAEVEDARKRMAILDSLS